MFRILQLNEIQFSTFEEKEQTASNLLLLLMSYVRFIITSIKTNEFLYDNYSFDRQSTSGLTKMTGFYLIVNKRTKKIYFGTTTNLAQWKGEHKSGLFKQQNKKLLNSFRVDLQSGEPTDFYFVPLVGFSKAFAQEYFSNSKDLQVYLETKIEEPFLETFLQEFPNTFYNVKTNSRFEKGNKYGGTPQSGSPSIAVMFENYAWESVTAAAVSLNVAAKSICNKRDAGLFQNISKNEFALFKGSRIFQAGAKDFFVNKPDQLRSLKQRLGFR